MAGLFDPIAIRNLVLPNRILMPAMTTRLAAADGSVTPELTAYYLERARGGTGLIIVEMTSPEPAGRHRAGELSITDEKYRDGLRRLNDRLHEAGARTAIQIGHAGGHTRADVTGYPPIAPSAISHIVQEVDTRTVMPEAMSHERIRQVVQAFAEAAQWAKAGGFDAAEIHGAHGYLIAQFLTPLENRRTDEYGGSLAYRARFALEVLRAARQRVGDFPLLFRISADEFAPGGLTPAEAVEVCRWAEQAGADALHVSAGCYRSLPSGAMMTPPMNYPDGVFVHLAQAVKAAVSVPVVAVGRLHDPALAGRVVAEGKADLIALGRALVADPHWARKTREGRGEPIRACISCNSCVDGMRQGSRIQCLVNPAAARETMFSRTPSPRPRRMLVAGGGPAGMEAAAALARRGHTVVLVERGGMLGGQWLQAMKAPRFQNAWTAPPVMQRYLDYQAAELKRLGVEVRLGRSASRALAQEWRAEAAISATGAAYRLPFNWIIPPLLDSALMRTGWMGRLAGRPAFKWLLFRVLRRSAATLVRELAGTGIEIHAIGDCVTPGTTLEAIRAAAELAERL